MALTWPDDHWDHWIRENSAMRSRNVIIPEVSRVFHAGVDGVFMNVDMHMQLFHYIAPYGGTSAIDFDMSTVTSSTHYRKRLVQKMASATPVSSARQLFQQLRVVKPTGESEDVFAPVEPLSSTDVVIW